jgi:predicted nucleic acid-binding protein
VNFLLDTNLVSEWTKPRPNPGVVSWLADADEDRVFISVVTIQTDFEASVAAVVNPWSAS